MGYSIVNVDEIEPSGPGGVIRFDPETTRQPVAGPNGLTFVSVGAPRGGGYEPRGPF